MTTKERDSMRKVQDALVRVLERRPFFRDRPNVPLCEGGPSLNDLRRFLVPTFDAAAYLRHLEDD